MDKNSEQLLITAIIPVGGFPNGTDQITHWLSNPSLAKFEIILVIDSDSIEVKAQVDYIAGKLREITQVTVLISNERNPGGTRNIGLKHAKGSWITFWDCDDTPRPSEFLEMISFASKVSADVAVGSYKTNWDLGSRNYPIHQIGNLTTLESIALNPGLWRFAFRAELARQFQFPGISMAEDQVYLSKVLSESKNIFVQNQIVYEYWLYPNNQLTKSKNAISDLRQAFLYFEEKYQSHKCEEYLIVLSRLTVTSIRKDKKGNSLKILLRYFKVLLLNISSIPLAIHSLRLIWKSK
jgi:glycosyltransferase involved in cell wall biosynthesis